MSLRDVFSVEQADAIQGVLQRAVETLADEAGLTVARLERELKSELRAKFAEFENRQLQQENRHLRRQLGLPDDEGVVDFDAARRAVRG